MMTTVLNSEAMPLYTAASSLPSDPPDEAREAEEELDVDREVTPPAPTALQAARIKAIVVDHHTFVWRSLVRLGVPRSDAEDALQQVFMVTARRIDDITTGSERSFLYGVCLRVASRARRTFARRREIVGDDCCPERIDQGVRPDEALDRARAKALLDEILSTMPLELRAVFTLFELEQLTMSEIATIVGVPQGTVASRLRRARELFAEQRKRIDARLRSRRELAGPERRVAEVEGA
jgi:RNA polymerase sigma-70 factor (ECF subfamily)